MVSDIRNINMIVGGIIIIIVIGLVYVMSNKFTKPILELVAITKEVSNGNLMINCTNCDSNDEIGELSKGFNIMMENMKNLINEIKKASAIVANTSHTLTQSTEETSNSIGDVTHTMSEVTSTIQQEVENTKEGSIAVDELSHELDEASRTIKESIDMRSE